jgi:hypothetical protein
MQCPTLLILFRRRPRSPRDPLVAQLRLEFETKNFLDLAHGTALGWHRLPCENRAAQASEFESSAASADHIPIEADRGFRIVTAYSGLGRKSVNFEQNPRSASSSITGHVR